MHRTRTLLLAAAGVACSSQVFAAGIAVARFGAELGYPVTTNPTAIYYNPAGLAESKGIHIFVDGTFAYRKSSYEHTTAPTDTPEPAGAEGSNNGKATLTNILAIPMVGLSAEVLPSLVVGGGVYAPLGGTSMWDKNDKFKNDPQYAGLVDGQNRWYSIEGTIKSTYFTAGGAYKIPNTGLSIGATYNLIQSVVDTVRARTPTGTNDINVEGRSYLDASGWQHGFGAGLMFEAIPKRLWFGASYQSRPNVAGGMVLPGVLRTRLKGGSDEKTDVDLTQDMPDFIRAGVRFKAKEDIELRLSGDYSRWSALVNQCMGERGKPCTVVQGEPGPSNPDAGAHTPGSTAIQNLPRNWQDAFGVKLSGSYWVIPKLELMAGVAYDGNAIPDSAMDPALLDFNDINMALGGRYQFVDQFFAALTYTHIYYIPRDTTGKNLNAQYQTPSTNPDAGGKYNQMFGILNVNVEVVF